VFCWILLGNAPEIAAPRRNRDLKHNAFTVDYEPAVDTFRIVPVRGLGFVAISREAVVSVGQVPRPTPYVIGRWVMLELNRIDLLATFEYRFGDSVHAIHYFPIRGENDGERQVRFVDQTNVLKNGSPRLSFVFSGPPFVKFANPLVFGLSLKSL
jgi:hypothetical protein